MENQPQFCHKSQYIDVVWMDILYLARSYFRLKFCDHPFWTVWVSFLRNGIKGACGGCVSLCILPYSIVVMSFVVVLSSVVLGFIAVVVGFHIFIFCAFIFVFGSLFSPFRSSLKLRRRTCEWKGGWTPHRGETVTVRPQMFRSLGVACRVFMGSFTVLAL